MKVEVTVKQFTINGVTGDKLYTIQVLPEEPSVSFGNLTLYNLERKEVDEFMHKLTEELEKALKI